MICCVAEKDTKKRNKQDKKVKNEEIVRIYNRDCNECDKECSITNCTMCLQNSSDDFIRHFAMRNRVLPATREIGEGRK